MSTLVIARLDTKQLRAIVPGWLALWRRVEAPVFQHPAWALTVPAGEDRVGYAAFAGSRLVGLVALSVGSSGVWFAGHPLNDANEVLADDANSLTTVLRAAAAAHPASLRLEHLDPTGPTVAVLHGNGGLDVTWVESEVCPVLPVGAHPTPHLAKRLARERRANDVAVAFRRPTGSEVEAFVRRRLRAWSARGAIERLGEVERHPSFPGALGRACGALAAERLCRMASLVVAGRTVAEDLYLGDRRRPLLYMRSYERGSCLSSPGLHLAQLAQEQPDLGDIDLGRGAEEYKMRLGARPRDRVAADVSPGPRP